MARAAVAARPETLMVRASTGAPGWAAVPWVAWFAPQVTRSMRHGLYVAAFVDPLAERVVLSLQHGAADALRDLGPEAGRDALRARAAATRAALGDAVGAGLMPGPCPLAPPGDLPQGYRAGSVLWRDWPAGTPDPAGFGAVLTRLLDLYRLAVAG